MFESTGSQVYASEVLELVHAMRHGASRRDTTPAISGGESPSSNGSRRDAGPVPHEVGLLRSTSDARLVEAVAYIHRHLEDPIGVQELVSHVGVSRRWLEYAFRDALGETPYQYIRRQRLEHAGRLLEEEPNSRIYQIALRTGFNSAKQLTMAFRQHFGLSPRDYRRRQCG